MRKIFKYVSAIIVTITLLYLLSPIIKRHLRTTIYDHYSNKTRIGINPTLPEKEIQVVTFSYNNRDWVQKNLDSIFGQNYRNFNLLYIDDASTDGTADLVESYIKDHHLEDRITLIKNNSWSGGASNLYHAIGICNDHTIMVVVDGDDWLKDNSVFKRLNTIYSTEDVWATYGQYEEWRSSGEKMNHAGCEPVRWDIVKNNTYREHGCTFSHLRTCYTWLAKQVKLESFLYKGAMALSHNDLVYMVPVMEMAGIHGRFIPEVLYVLNREPRPYEDKSLLSQMSPSSYFLDPKNKYAALPSKRTPLCPECSVEMLDLTSKFPTQQSPSFKEMVANKIKELSADYIALKLDSSASPKLNLKACAQALKRTHAYCFYVNLSDEAFEKWDELAYTPFTKDPCCKQYAPLGNKLIAFDFEVTNDDLWRSERLTDLLVMRKDDLSVMLEQKSFSNLAELQEAFREKPTDGNHIGLFLNR